MINYGRMCFQYSLNKVRLVYTSKTKLPLSPLLVQSDNDSRGDELTEPVDGGVVSCCHVLILPLAWANWIQALTGCVH